MHYQSLVLGQTVKSDYLFNDDNASPTTINATPQQEKSANATPQQDKTKRLGNFTMEEDKSLVVAWLDTSMNPTIGIDQKGKTFWDKVANNFHDRSNGSSNKRPQRSLQCRYGEIQKAVNKFIGTLTKVQNSKHSELDELDKIDKAKTMYHEIYGVHFKFEHCWNILRNHPKWAKSNGVLRRMRRINPPRPCTPSLINLDDTNAQSPHTPTSFVDLEKPIGEKAALTKQNKKKGKETEDTSILAAWTTEKEKFYVQKVELERERLTIYKREIENNNEVEKARLALEEKKQESKRARIMLEEQREERSIMFMNLSECDDDQREYIQLRRTEILAKRRLTS